ncbi:hypothetical protein KHQ88_01995 [Mycoplasmatota bacterium]|nr:hypothetical protein KHQ88_01995 [Mycoplasmatota bacterium]
MKKLLTFLFAAFLLIGLAACNGERTYAADGEYTAFDIDYHHGAPMITEVTVTIEDDEITGYYIDALQSSLGEEGVTWNEKTKKELGDDYGMVENGGAIAEWYVQAERIEAFWLENGADAVTTDEDNYIDNVTDVTMKDGGYSDLAIEAVQQAKDGITKAYVTTLHYNGTANVTWATLEVDAEGDIVDLELDVLQSSITDGTFAWNEKTKQELGDDYGMATKNGNANGGLYEWYEQADMITDYIMENGWEDSFTVADSDLDTETDVTISTGDYEKVLKAVFDKIA